MNRINKLKHNYDLPTPKKWRRIGDLLLVICLFATPYPVVHDNHTLQIVFLFVGIVGKILTNFFSKEEA